LISTWWRVSNVGIFQETMYSRNFFHLISVILLLQQTASGKIHLRVFANPIFRLYTRSYLEEYIFIFYFPMSINRVTLPYVH